MRFSTMISILLTKNNLFYRKLHTCSVHSPKDWLDTNGIVDVNFAARSEYLNMEKMWSYILLIICENGQEYKSVKYIKKSVQWNACKTFSNSLLNAISHLCSFMQTRLINYIVTCRSLISVHLFIIHNNIPHWEKCQS